MILLADVSRLYRFHDGETHALRSIDLHVRPGEFVAVLGPSGCGKSTLLNIIGMVDRPTSGKYLFKDRDVTRLKAPELTRLRRREVGVAFQGFDLIDHLTIAENVDLGLMYRGWTGKARRARVGAALERLGVAHSSRCYPHQLSRGQQQRAAIARAIVGQPDLILADEPTGALDSENVAQVMEILRNLNAEGATIVMATHAPVLAALAGRRIDMLDGRLAPSAGEAM